MNISWTSAYGKPLITTIKQQQIKVHVGLYIITKVAFAVSYIM